MDEKFIEEDEIETVSDKIQRKKRRLKEDDIFVRDKKKDKTFNKEHEKKLSKILSKINKKKLNKDEDIKKVMMKLKKVISK